MSVCRFAIFFLILSYILASSFFFALESKAETPLIRKAATPPATDNVPDPRATNSEETGTSTRKTRIGLSPVPFKPGPAENETG